MKRSFKNSACIIMLVPIFILSCRPFSLPSYAADISDIKSASHGNGIFFGLVTGDIESSYKRREFQFNNWLKNLHLYGYGYSYIIEGNPNITYNHSSIVPTYMIKPDKNSERAAKKLSAAFYFYYNTTYQWLWISNDDISVSITRLQKLVDLLNTKYDTYNDAVVLGSCVGHPTPFIQGGSGMILSRKAAYNFTEYGVKWIKEKVVQFDDVEFNEFIKLIGETPSSCNIPHMIGHTLIQSLPINLNYIPECNNIQNYPTTCFTKPQSADDIVAIHLNSFPHGWDQIQELEKHTGEGLMWYNVRLSTRLCKIVNKTK